MRHIARLPAQLVIPSAPRFGKLGVHWRIRRPGL